MSAFSPVRRAAVVERAGHRCEYCHLPTKGQVATFPIDHVYPKSLGGDQAMENLALTCPHCNAYKWTSVEGVDLDTGETVPLFDPRRQTWTDHFFWNAEEPCELNGRTATGRATIIQLRINDPDMLQLRALLIALGIFND